MDVKAIGSFLAAQRRKAGLTQEQLGERLSVSNKTVSRWENGNYLPPVEMLQLMSDLYGITINEILSAKIMDDAEYRVRAEENIKSALQSSFTLKERIGYFKRKWRKEHRFEFLCGMLLVTALYLGGIFWMNGLQLAGYAFCIWFLLWQNNQMMIYVEERAFDGSGLQ